VLQDAGKQWSGRRDSYGSDSSSNGSDGTKMEVDLALCNCNEDVMAIVSTN
jgi:hypothetical protein